MSLDSLLFCYSYALAFLAGTDNSSKNTYFKIDPIKQDMSAEADETFSSWWLTNFGVSFNYSECYLMYMDGDDMDSILRITTLTQMINLMSVCMKVCRISCLIWLSLSIQTKTVQL